MDNSLVCQTSVIDPIGTLQHALETNNVSCKLLSFCSVVETQVEGYLLSLQILCHCKIRLHLWNILWILGLKGAFLSWFLVSFFSIYLYQPTPFPSAHESMLYFWSSYDHYYSSLSHFQSLLAVYWCWIGLEALPYPWSAGLHRWDICNPCNPAGIDLGCWSCTQLCNRNTLWVTMMLVKSPCSACSCRWTIYNSLDFLFFSEDWKAQGRAYGAVRYRFKAEG